MPDYDPDEGINFAAYTTVRDSAEEYDVTEEVVRQWIHRQGIKAVGMYPDRRKIYMRADLSKAEFATRHRAPLRGEITIAAHQLAKRPNLRRRHKPFRRASAA